MKYTTVIIDMIITQIAKTTDVEGYTVGILEVLIPDDKEIKNWTNKEASLWITRNNNRMNAICKFLNENEL